MIKDIIENFVAQFPELSSQEKKELTLLLNVKNYNKGQIIQEEGKTAHNCFFVLKGLVREYQLIDGIDKTLEFYSESHPAIPSEGYAKVKPSETSLECLENSFLIVGDKESESRAIESIPALQGILTCLLYTSPSPRDA